MILFSLGHTSQTYYSHTDSEWLIYSVSLVIILFLLSSLSALETFPLQKWPLGTV